MIHYTDQEAFDTVVVGLRSQGFKRSMGEGICRKVCKYRGDDGLRCAIGHLIPDEKYREDMDTNGTLSEVLEAGQIEMDLRFAVELQKAHDFCDNNPGEMVGNFVRIAEKYGLSVEKLGTWGGEEVSQ